MSDINKLIADGIRTQLRESGLDDQALEKPGAHVVVPGQGSDVHLLIKKTTASDGISTLEAEVRGAGNARRGGVELSEEPTRDLGELGIWREFKLTGLAPDLGTTASGQPLRLEILSAGPDEAKVGAAFFSSMDLALVLDEVVGAGALLLRPLPTGERNGTTYVDAGPELRQAIRRLTGRAVDDTVSASSVAAALQAWHELQATVAAGGLLSVAHLVGKVPGAAELPRPVFTPSPAKVEAVPPGGFSSEASLVLGKLAGVVGPAPTRLTAAWVERVIDHLPSTTSPEVAAELRARRLALLDQAEAVVDDLFGAELGGTKVPVAPAVVQAGDARLAQSRAYKFEQLSKGLEALSVPSEVVGEMATVMAEALQPSSRPAVVMVAGPRYSAADRLFELGTLMVGKNPLALDLRAGLAAMLGAIKNVPTGADGLLARPNVDAHRDTPARHAPVVIADLTAVGAAAGDGSQTQTTLELLERLVDLAETGKTTVFSRGPTGVSEPREVALPNTVFLLRWPADPAALDKLLAQSPRLASLRGRVIGIGGLQGEAAINLVAQHVERGLTGAGMAKGTTVELGDEVRAVLRSAVSQLGIARVIESLGDRLVKDLTDLVQSGASQHYVVTFDRGITPSDKQRLGRLEAIPFASRTFSARPGTATDVPTLALSDNWEDVVVDARRTKQLELELNKLRAQLASQRGSLDTV